ncbi:MAG: tetratricopeptide repeat protein [Desulfatiglandales bacterium]
MKKQLRTIIFSFKGFILFTAVLSISPQITEAQQAIVGPVGQTRANWDIIRGIELLYNWEFEKAENLFQKVVEQNPNDPGAYFYLAMVTWSRLASGFWSRENVEEFSTRIDRAISVAQTQIESEKSDSFTYFYLGGALGFKGRFKLMQRKWLSSFFLAVDAIEALNTCLKLDPNNKDVLFGLGIFDYYTDRLSGVLKWLTFFLVHKGNKEEGLRKLHIAAEEAIYSSIEAKSLLVHIYLFLERDSDDKAVVLAEDLADQFRRNARVKFLQGVAYIRLGMDPKYREVLDYLNGFSHNENPGRMARIWENRALYLEATYYLSHDQYDMARSKLEAILSRTGPSDPSMVAWPLVKKGMSYDLEGDRERALTYYKRVLSMKNGAGAQFLAEKYIDAAAQKGDPFIGY